MLRATAVAQAQPLLPALLRDTLPVVAATPEGRRALLQLRDGHTVAAAQAMLPLLARSDALELRILHGWLAVAAEDPEAALRELPAGAAEGGDEGHSLAVDLVRAAALAASGRAAEAVPLYRRVVAATPEPDLLRAAAQAAWEGGDAAWCADCLLALRTAGGLSPGEELLLARSLTRARRFAEARAAWDSVLARPEVPPETWEEAGLAAFAEGEATGSAEAWERALRCFETVLAGDPQNARAQFNLGCVLDWSGAVEDAVAAYERALEIRPDHVAAARNLVHALRRLHRPEEAAAVLEELRRQPLAPADAAWVQETLAALTREPRTGEGG